MRFSQKLAIVWFGAELLALVMEGVEEIFERYRPDIADKSLHGVVMSIGLKWLANIWQKKGFGFHHRETCFKGKETRTHTFAFSD